MNAFAERLQPAPRDGGFALDEFWVWCGSVIRGEDGRYHMFASRWSREVSFWPHWVTNSEVVRAVSDTPVGPYHFEEVVLPARGAEFWDGRMTHNPTIHRCGDTYLLFYVGTTYEEPMPTRANPEIWGSELVMKARANQRIGLATAPSVCGPWTRRDAPILEPREGKWDALMTTNPAPCVQADSSVLLIYKAVGFDKDLLRLGVAHAKYFEGPYQRLKDEPIFRFDDTRDHVEDAYVWRENDEFHLVMKDMNGGICGEKGGGIYAVSPDGIAWRIAEPPQAYSRKVLWSDGTTTMQGHLERPQLLIENNVPTHLFFATGDGPGGFTQMTRSWNMVIPLSNPNTDCNGE